MFSCKFLWEYQIAISFSKVKLLCTESKVMVNQCVVTNCSISYETGQKKALLHFHEY